MNGSEYYKRWAITYFLLVALAAISNPICLVLSRYRVWTHTLFGFNQPETNPEITASAMTG